MNRPYILGSWRLNTNHDLEGNVNADGNVSTDESDCGQGEHCFLTSAKFVKSWHYGPHHFMRSAAIQSTDITPGDCLLSCIPTEAHLHGSVCSATGGVCELQVREVCVRKPAERQIVTIFVDGACLSVTGCHRIPVPLRKDAEGKTIVCSPVWKVARDLEIGDLVFCSSAGQQCRNWAVYGGMYPSCGLELS